MNCFEAQDKIIDLILGELSPEDRFMLKEHLSICSLCSTDFELLSECCIHERSETCEYQFHEAYWEEFIVLVHEKIRHEKIEKKFPFHIILPIAASALAAFVVGYYFFLKPVPEETLQETLSDYEYDIYEEVYELSTEETEEFIKMINQRYGDE